MIPKLTTLALADSSALVLVAAAGCSTMPTTTLTTGAAASYTPHETKNELTVGVRPLGAPAENKQMFNINLPGNGLLPVLVVAENRSPSDSFILPKEQILLVSEAPSNTNACCRKQITSSSAGMPLVVTGALLYPSILGAVLFVNGVKVASNASVTQYDVDEKEFYTRTLGPGEKAEGFAYFPVPAGSACSGNYRLLVGARNSSSGAATTFEFPITFNPSK